MDWEYMLNEIGLTDEVIGYINMIGMVVNGDSIWKKGNGQIEMNFDDQTFIHGPRIVNRFSNYFDYKDFYCIYDCANEYQ